MKKKILLVVTSVICATAVYVGVSSHANYSQADLFSQNLEALTNGEGSDKGTLYGNQAGTRYCCKRDSSNSCSAAGC